MPKTNQRFMFVAGLAVAAGLAVRATADDNTRIDWQVSLDNHTWSSVVQTNPGGFVFVRAIVSYTGSVATVGLNGFIFQPTVSNWDAEGSGDLVDTLAPFVDRGMGSNTSTPIGVVTDPADPTQFGRLSPWGRAALSSTSSLHGHIHTGGSAGAPPGGWLRIAQAQITSWFGGQGNTSGGSRIPISQLSQHETVDGCLPCPPYIPRPLDLYVFKFGFTLSRDSVARTLVVDAPLDGFGNRDSVTGDREVYWFASDNEALGSVRGTPVVLPATIVVAPCGSADFNGDGDSGTDADIEAFFACIAGNCCATCGSADFNGDGDTATDADIEAFFRVLAGGSC